MTLFFVILAWIAQAIFSLYTYCGFIPLTRVVQDDIFFLCTVFVFDITGCSIGPAESYTENIFPSSWLLFIRLSRDVRSKCFVFILAWGA